jgi:ribosomal protein L18E
MEATLSPEMNGCVSQITSRLATLAREEQVTVLREVSNRLEDLRAKQVYEDVVSGTMTTTPSGEIMADLKAKHGL